jgi:phosphohistidine phosphatase
MLYIVRHAHAVDREDDSARELSGRGREQVRRAGALLRESGAFRPDEIWHSPLVRAQQTAELLAAAAGLKVPVREKAGLLSEDNPAVIAARIPQEHSVALVGHEPHLGGLASLLVAGAAFPPAFHIGKCAILALEYAGRGSPGRWVVCWHLAAELIP